MDKVLKLGYILLDFERGNISLKEAQMLILELADFYAKTKQK